MFAMGQVIGTQGGFEGVIEKVGLEYSQLFNVVNQKYGQSSYFDNQVRTELQKPTLDHHFFINILGVYSKDLNTQQQKINVGDPRKFQLALLL